MGFLGDLKSAAAEAAAIRPDVIEVVPAERIDTLVEAVGGGSRHRTDYAGTIWFGGRPQIQAGHPMPGASFELDKSVPLPDSHAYEPGAEGSGALLQASGAVQGGMATSSGGNFQIIAVGAALRPDPSSSGALAVSLDVSAVATLPLGVSYRVVVICDPSAVREVG